jgi:hypothetical protein
MDAAVEERHTAAAFDDGLENVAISVGSRESRVSIAASHQQDIAGRLSMRPQRTNASSLGH